MVSMAGSGIDEERGPNGLEKQVKVLERIRAELDLQKMSQGNGVAKLWQEMEVEVVGRFDVSFRFEDGQCWCL
jgi:hypothetical protein